MMKEIEYTIEQSSRDKDNFVVKRPKLSGAISVQTRDWLNIDGTSIGMCLVNCDYMEVTFGDCSRQVTLEFHVENLDHHDFHTQAEVEKEYIRVNRMVKERRKKLKILQTAVDNLSAAIDTHDIRNKTDRILLKKLIREKKDKKKSFSIRNS